MADTTPADRGYRVQALYTLVRVLTSGEADRTFAAEVGEDLGAFVDGRRVVVIQVGAYMHNLALSDLEPEKERSLHPEHP